MRKKRPQKNYYAFIDAQNVYQSLSRPIDYSRFRTYLRDKYRITKAYYFLGFQEKEAALYENIQDAGFILVFNLKGEHLKSKKKGNVDTSIVFHVMQKLIEGEMDGAVLVSGDGDYKMLVDYLIEKNKLIKILTPNLEFASSLYKHARHLDSKYFDYLDQPGIKKKIAYTKKAP